MRSEVRGAAAPLRRRRAAPGSGRRRGTGLAALRRVAVVVGLLVLLPAPPTAPTSVPQATSTPRQTSAPEPTSAPQPTSSSRATSTPEPTSLPQASSSPRPSAALAPTPPVPFRLLQLNLCLSGLAECYGGARVVDEAIARIAALQPDVVTVDEACLGDVERIAAATQRAYRFATVIYGGAPLTCILPDTRGVFGNAVLTTAPITAVQDEPFTAQSDLEQRRWLCVVTADDVRACTTHLSVASTPVDVAANAAQCAELAAALAGGGPHRATVFGGDLNRQDSCAPPGFWSLRDSAASKTPGVQHAYGSPASLLQPQAQVLSMTRTDHDALLVDARLTAPESAPAPSGPPAPDPSERR